MNFLFIKCDTFFHFLWRFDNMKLVNNSAFGLFYEFQNTEFKIQNVELVIQNLESGSLK